MAKKSKRISVLLVNEETGYHYVTSKNTQNTSGKLMLKKFDRKLRKHLVFKEKKVSS